MDYSIEIDDYAINWTLEGINSNYSSNSSSNSNNSSNNSNSNSNRPEDELRAKVYYVMLPVGILKAVMVFGGV